MFSVIYIGVNYNSVMSYIQATSTGSCLAYSPMLVGKHETEKEIDKGQLIESEGHLVNTEVCLEFISHRLYIPQCKEEGYGERLLYQDTRNKRSLLPSQKPKASSNHTLGQNVLLVTTWVKPPVIEP